MILAKRSTLSNAYDEFDYTLIATYSDAKIDELLNNPGVIRNKLKINAAISNAKAFMVTQKAYGRFDSYIWSFVGNELLMNHWTTIDKVPTSTDLSDKLSKDLKKKGFKFLGATTMYAFMQSVGIVNDHLDGCLRK